MNFLKSKKKVIIVMVLIVSVAGGIFSFAKYKTSTPAAKIETTAKVTKGNIKIEVSGSGVIDPIDSYNIYSLVSGTIINSPFEEGDTVKKDDILYKIDATEIESNIEKTMNSIDKLNLSNNDSNKSITKCTVYAGASGRLKNFNVKENDTVTTSKLAEIVDDSYSIAKVPFSESQVKSISIGQNATVNSQTLMSTVSGTVSKINNYSIKKSEGSVLYEVEITVQGNNGLIEDSTVTATIGGMESPEVGVITTPESTPVTSSVSGLVKAVYVTNNDYVQKGQKLFELDNDTYISKINQNNIESKDYEATLKTQKKNLEDYNIKSPIDGTVLEKSKKVNDTVNPNVGTTESSMMIVADMSKVKFSMKIDELDINKLKLGQAVNVTADAISDKVYFGIITKIAGKGTASNGVSNYLVEVTIDQPGDLKPGMNVDAKTVVSEKDNAILVPASAVTKKDGANYVTLPSDLSESSKEVRVEIGLNNKDFIEIVSGLREGDTIVVPEVEEETSTKKNFGGPMGGQM